MRFRFCVFLSSSHTAAQHFQISRGITLSSSAINYVNTIQSTEEKEVEVKELQRVPTRNNTNGNSECQLQIVRG